MPHIIRHTFVCDICGFSFPPEERRVESGMSFTDYRTDYDTPMREWGVGLPWNMHFINGQLVCYKHRIIVEHNGDMVTVKEANT